MFVIGSRVKFWSQLFVDVTFLFPFFCAFAFKPACFLRNHFFAILGIVFIPVLLEGAKGIAKLCIPFLTPIMPVYFFMA